MANTAYGTGAAQHTFSPLVLCDSLLSLARQADRAGLRRTADRLLHLATSVFDEPPVRQEHGVVRARRRPAGH